MFLRLWCQHPFLHKTKGPTRNPISPTPPPLPSAGVHVTPPPPQSNFQVAQEGRHSAVTSQNTVVVFGFCPGQPNVPAMPLVHNDSSPWGGAGGAKTRAPTTGPSTQCWYNAAPRAPKKRIFASKIFATAGKKWGCMPFNTKPSQQSLYSSQQKNDMGSAITQFSGGGGGNGPVHCDQRTISRLKRRVPGGGGGGQKWRRFGARDPRLSQSVPNPSTRSLVMALDCMRPGWAPRSHDVHIW